MGDDSREQTRQRLLDAAETLIAHQGLQPTSIEHITAAAGYTRGAFYSNYSSKSDLFIGLLRRDHHRGKEYLDALRSRKAPVADLQRDVGQICSRLYCNNLSFIIWAEARLLAARHTHLRAKLNALMTEKRDQVVELVCYFYERAGAPPPAQAGAIAMGLMSFAAGIHLHVVSSPTEMTPATADELLNLFVGLLIQRAHRLAVAAPERDISIPGSIAYNE